MRLALDAMGGDQAPCAMMQRALDYARDHSDHTVILVGRRDDIERSLISEAPSGCPANIVIEHADETIGMADKISALKDKPNDSMNRCAQLVKTGEADAMILCGNTGCSVAAAQLHLRRIRGVKRAGILTPLPTPNEATWVIDCGANTVGKAEHLAQFAEMASAFLERYRDGSAPRVGVLNIGSEDEKGNELTSETLALVRANDDLNCIGYVEGNDIFSGVVDVVVCDGFTGNVVLKTAEGVAKAIGSILKDEINQSGPLTKLGALAAKPAFTRLRKRTHWSKVGGCLLLGVNGITIIGHGRSDRVAVESALIQAARCVERDIISGIREHLTP
ncbi:MAG: phosphate acyltransferase PlsX [Planctomycetota bacterium]|jgi:glycerol-3-phosphate acyltransferase PlsX